MSPPPQVLVLPAASICPLLQMGRVGTPGQRPEPKQHLIPLAGRYRTVPSPTPRATGIDTDAPPPLRFLFRVQVLDLCTRHHHPVLFLAASTIDLASLIRSIFICLLLYKKAREAELFAGSHSLEGRGLVPLGGIVCARARARGRQGAGCRPTR